VRHRQQHAAAAHERLPQRVLAVRVAHQALDAGSVTRPQRAALGNGFSDLDEMTPQQVLACADGQLGKTQRKIDPRRALASVWNAVE